jgi:hypothetical protein
VDAQPGQNRGSRFRASEATEGSSLEESDRTEFVTLDGVVEAPEKWHVPYIEDEMLELVGKRYLASDALLLGRVTYHSFVGSRPFRTAGDFAFADHMNAGLTKYVVSATLDEVGEVGQRDAHQGGCRGRRSPRASSPSPTGRQ